MYRKRHFPIICALFCAVVSIVLGIGIGSVNISPGEIFTAIGVRFFGAQLPEDMPITTVNTTQTFRENRPARGIPGKEASLEKLANTGRTEFSSRKKFQSALVSPRKIRKYRAT